MAGYQAKELPKFQYKILLHDIVHILYKKCMMQDKTMDENLHKEFTDMM